MWKKPLKQSFGIVDKRFAMHPADELQAREARKLIKKMGATWEEVEAEIERVLAGAAELHMQEQLRAARKYFKFA